MSYRVVFSPEAGNQLAALHEYIADAASPEVAAGYTEAIICYCEGLHSFPLRGTPRDDVRPGLPDQGKAESCSGAWSIRATTASAI